VNTTLTLVRGLPGVGKTTYATALAKELGGVVFSADDYFVAADGTYNFNLFALPAAHAECESKTIDALQRGNTNIFVANTFTRPWEMAPYFDAAARFNAPLTIVTVTCDLTDEQLAARNVHGVPVEKIATMRQRFELSEKIPDSHFFLLHPVKYLTLHNLQIDTDQ
jgi:predicted kinase